MQRFKNRTHFVRQGSSATRTSGFVNGIVSPFWPSWAGNQFTVSSPDEQSAVRVRPSITSQLTAESSYTTSHLTPHYYMATLHQNTVRNVPQINVSVSFFIEYY